MGLLLLGIAVGVVFRITLVVTGEKFSGMSDEYAAMAYMMASGYGYNRTDFLHWHGQLKDELQQQSEALAAEGRQLTELTRPSLGGHALSPQQFRPPGYPAFMLVVYRFLGEPLALWTGVVEAVLSGLTVLLVYALTRRLFRSERAALLAVWLTALYPPLAFAAAMQLPENLVTLMVLCSVYCVALAATTTGSRSFAFAALAGLALAVSCYLRANAMLLWVPLGLSLALAYRSATRGAVATLLMAAALYAALLPWAAWNHQRSGHWLWGSTGTGMTTWKSIGEYPNPWGIKVDDRFTTEYARAAGFDSDVTPEADEWFRAKVREHIKESPSFFGKATLKRLFWTAIPPYETWYVNPYRDHDKGLLSYYKNTENLTPWQVLVSHPGYVVAAYWERLLVMAGSLALLLCMAWVSFQVRFEPGYRALVVSVPLYFMAIHAVTVFAPRYQLPMLPLQMVAAALVIDRLIQASRDRRVRSLKR